MPIAAFGGGSNMRKSNSLLKYTVDTFELKVVNASQHLESDAISMHYY